MKTPVLHTLACSDTETTCLYTKMSKKIIKLNQVPARVAYSEVIEGFYSVRKTNTIIEVIDTKSDFSIRVTTNPSGKAKIINKISNGIFIIRFRPSRGSGTMFKFFN